MQMQNIAQQNSNRGAIENNSTAAQNGYGVKL